MDLPNPLIDKIAYYANFSINWPISVKVDIGDNQQITLGGCHGSQSRNPLYVTLADPVPGLTMYHTVVHRACVPAAGKTTEEAAVNGIWNYFKGMDVRNFENEPAGGMKYWQNAGMADIPAAGGVPYLLANHDGRCGAWARLMRDVLKAHGIAAGNRPILPDPSAPGVPAGIPGPHGIFVKNWTTTPPYTSLLGVAGQGGVANPHSAFIDHAVTEWNGKLYDPSYGTGPFTTLLAWQRASLDLESISKLSNTQLVQSSVPDERARQLD